MAFGSPDRLDGESNTKHRAEACFASGCSEPLKKEERVRNQGPTLHEARWSRRRRHWPAPVVPDGWAVQVGMVREFTPPVGGSADCRRSPGCPDGALPPRLECRFESRDDGRGPGLLHGEHDVLLQCAQVLGALLQFYLYYGNDGKVECPTGSGRLLSLYQVAEEIARRLSAIFLRDGEGRRPVYGGTPKFQTDPQWRDLIHFHEYFHGDNGAGLGASHQTGWTGLVATLMELFASVSADQILSGGLRDYFRRADM